jgi:hypothetical protein
MLADTDKLDLEQSIEEIWGIAIRPETSLN